ncbi:hypothetical protein OQA88_5720 [Cercophora sp. LCS_1]
MPGTVKEAASKRKRQENGEQVKKRRKSGGDESAEALSQIQKLEAEVIESKKHYNNLVTLIALAKGQDGDRNTAMVAAESLCRVFIHLLVNGKLVKKQDVSEKDATVRTWLWERLNEYHTFLFSMLGSEASAIKAMMLIMVLLKEEAFHMSGREEAQFPRNFFGEFIVRVFVSKVEQLREQFCEQFVAEFDDIRFYTLQIISEYFREAEHSVDIAFRDNVFDLLVGMDDVPEELESFYIEAPKKRKHPLNSISQHKKQVQEAWLAVMAAGLSKEQRKKVLEIMATSIAPWFTKPELLMDFLTDCYNAGGSTSLLALSGVFYLIQERNLDYPSFYTKLYSLLDADILHSKHRSRFFRLMDTFLASSHLPAVLVASFIKRLARLALNAPPSAIVAIVPWFYNVFKKHPLCTFMMHRVPRTKEERDLLESEGLGDPFIPDEEDPMKTNAIDSCIWEIVQLQSHYHPNVATIAKIVSEQFTKQSYGLEDFLDHSYGSLLDAEMSKEVKKPPVVEFMIPKRIFTKADSTEDKDGLLVSLWDFTAA